MKEEKLVSRGENREKYQIRQLKFLLGLSLFGLAEAIAAVLVLLLRS